MQEKYTNINSFSIENIPIYMDVAKNGCVIAFDTETTGLHNHDDIVQLAWVVMEKGEWTRADFTYVQNLSVALDGTEAAQVNGLTDAMIAAQGRDPKEVWRKFYGMIGDLSEKYGKVLLVAHNLPFDLRMVYHNAHRYLGSACSEFDVSKVIGCDTKEFVKSFHFPPEILPGHHLKNCVESFALDAVNSHDALDDTKACMKLFQFLTNDAE